VWPCSNISLSCCVSSVDIVPKVLRDMGVALCANISLSSTVLTV